MTADRGDEDERVRNSPAARALEETWSGEALAQWMARRELTVFDVAAHMGVSVDDVAEWTAGAYLGPVGAHLLAELLGVTTDDLHPGFRERCDRAFTGRRGGGPIG